jgi:hypothetical protein
MTASGASSAPTDIPSLILALNQVGGGDTVVENLVSSVGTSGSFYQTLMNKYQGIMSDVGNQSSGSALTENLNWSGQNLSNYLYLTTATATATATITTSDGCALNLRSGREEMASPILGGGSSLDSIFSADNFKSGNGTVVASIQVDGKNLPSSSAVKYICMKLNATGKGSIDCAITPGTVSDFSYAYDCVFYGALSFVNSSGVGGKLIISADVSDVKSVSSLSSSSSVSFVPSVEITATLYDDSGNVKLTKTWNSFAAFESDMQSLTAAFGSVSVQVQ